VDQSAESSHGPCAGARAAVCVRWEPRAVLPRSQARVAADRRLAESYLITAAQEIAAIVLATALLARERARAAAGQVPALRVKFGVVLAVVRSMWFYLGPCEDLLTERLKTRIVQRGDALMRRCVTAKRRSPPIPAPCGSRSESGLGSWRRTRSKDRWRSRSSDDMNTEFPNGIRANGRPTIRGDDTEQASMKEGKPEGNSKEHHDISATGLLVHRHLVVGPFVHRVIMCPILQAPFDRLSRPQL